MQVAATSLSLSPCGVVAGVVAGAGLEAVKVFWHTRPFDNITMR